MEVIDDETANAKNIHRVILCSGKIYYELLEERIRQNAERGQTDDIAIIRLEQVYPLPLTQLKLIIEKYKNADDFIWLQEEPENMGAWSYLLRTFKEVTLRLISRPESASPATGSHHAHEKEQEAIVEKAFEKILVN